MTLIEWMAVERDMPFSVSVLCEDSDATNMLKSLIAQVIVTVLLYWDVMLYSECRQSQFRPVAVVYPRTVFSCTPVGISKLQVHVSLYAEVRFWSLHGE
jgi:hypothetical protein